MYFETPIPLHEGNIAYGVFGVCLVGSFAVGRPIRSGQAFMCKNRGDVVEDDGMEGGDSTAAWISL